MIRLKSYPILLSLLFYLFLAGCEKTTNTKGPTHSKNQSPPKAYQKGPIHSKNQSPPKAYQKPQKLFLSKKYKLIRDGKWEVIRYNDSKYNSRGSYRRGALSDGHPIAPGGALYKEAAPLAPLPKSARRRGMKLKQQTHLSPQANLPLKAGERDDNEKFDQYLEYYHKNKYLVPSDYRVDVSERFIIEARDVQQRGLPNVEVAIANERDQIVWRGRTCSDGRLLFFPKLSPKSVGSKKFVISYTYGNISGIKEVKRERRSLQPIILPVKIKKEFEKVVLELLFLLDATGSMADEIGRIQATLKSIVGKIESLTKKDLQIRFGLVLYRDRGDEFLAKKYPFTSDIQEFQRALNSVRADGGGDYPEDMNTGLYAAVEKMDWNQSKETLRLIFLVADAPPHLDYPDSIPYLKTIQNAVYYGIKIYPIAASGLSPRGSFIMRQIALLSGARFLYIDYGEGTAEYHGIKAPGPSNNLDQLVFRIVKSEVKSFIQ